MVRASPEGLAWGERCDLERRESGRGTLLVAHEQLHVGKAQVPALPGTGLCKEEVT